jgi:hypothetical protein
MPRSVTKHKANGAKTSMEHQKLWIRRRRIISPIKIREKREVSLTGILLSPKLAEKEDLTAQLKPETSRSIMPKEEHL